MDDKEQDIILFNKIHKGDYNAFELLHNRYLKQLVEFSKKFIGDTEASKDVVQDLFLYIWEKRETLKINTSLKAYLFKATRNNSVKYLLNQKRKIESIDNLPDYSDLVKPDTHSDFLLMEIINNAINSLPEIMRITFKKSRIDGLRNEEIAEELNKDIHTVENQITEATKRMKIVLKEYKLK